MPGGRVGIEGRRPGDETTGKVDQDDMDLGPAPTVKAQNTASEESERDDDRSGAETEPVPTQRRRSQGAPEQKGGYHTAAKEATLRKA